MSLKDMSMSSNEKREQRIMLLRKGFSEKKFFTVKAACSAMGGYTERTVEKWAKDGDIPLLRNDGKTVVPVTDENSPVWLKEWLNGQSENI